MKRLAPAAILVAIALFASLGVWQLERRVWKLDLIASTEARLAAPPVPAPRPEAGPADAYTRVEATGRFLHDQETAVLAVTGLGSGYWILTPLKTRGFTVLVNRGFVPPDRRDPATRPEGQVAGEVGGVEGAERHRADLHEGVNVRRPGGGKRHGAKEPQG